MSELTTVDEILDFAIEREQEAADFYNYLADKASGPGVAKVFSKFADEEMGHKAKLEKVKDGKRMLQSQAKVQDLKIGDYLVEQQPTGELDYQAALILAMKKEKAAFKLYMDLSEKVDDADIKDLLQGLAQEEAKHKLRFELEYDERVLRDN